MTSREAILGRLHKGRVPRVEAPSLDQAWQHFDEPALRFEESVASVGGTTARVADGRELQETLEGLECYREANKVASAVAGIAKANVDLSAVDDPHDLRDVDLAILTGRFGVAENGAIWLDLDTVGHRVVCVLAQHLVVLVPRSEIVDTMHQAYERVGSLDQDGGRAGFGLFMSGPSKTADIEQSLVIGAHGARSLLVVLWEGELSLAPPG